MEQEELHRFIYFLTHNKSFSKEQHRRMNCLLARDFVMLSYQAQSRINVLVNNFDQIDDKLPQQSKFAKAIKFVQKKERDNKISSKVKHREGVKEDYISPKNIQQFLKEYNQDDVLKYTCHLIDADEVISSINNECDSDTYDFSKHIELIQKHLISLLKSYEERNVFLSPNIISLIHVYLTGKDIKGNNRTWSANKIDIGWGCDELISWAKKNPGKIPNPGPNIVRKQKNSGFSLTSAFLSETTGVRIKSFSQLVIFFKSQFHIRSDNSLKSILNHVNQRWNDTDVIFSFSKEKFNDNLELLTDVDKLIQSYTKIINLCIECKSEKGPIRVELSFYDEQDGGHTFFEINHQNSRYKKTLKNAIERIGESQARLVEKQINGLCDLYVEALFSDGQCARINLWDDSPKLTYSKTNNINGVKYILRF